VPADVLDKEKEIAKSQIEADPKNKAKPANVLDKIIEGKIKTWLAANVLLEQPFVKDDSKTIQQLLDETSARVGEKVAVRRFVRYKLGEGAE